MLKKKKKKTKTTMETKRQKPPLKLLDPKPNLCRTCHGEYSDRFKHEGEKDCKICSSTFIVAMWKTAPNSVRRIEVCYSCSELDNVCQLCNEECRRSERGGFLPIRVNEEELIPPKIDSPPRPPRLLKLKWSRREANDGLGCCHSGRIEFCRVCLLDRRRELRQMRT